MQPQDDCPVWAGWAGAIALLGLEELKPLVKRAFERADNSRPVVAHSGVAPHLPQLDGTTSALTLRGNLSLGAAAVNNVKGFLMAPKYSVAQDSSIGLKSYREGRGKASSD
jgi:hypothetical protein